MFLRVEIIIFEYVLELALSSTDLESVENKTYGAH